MNVLFVHNNFPAQFRNLAIDLASDPKHTVDAIGSQTSRDIGGVSLHRYNFESHVGVGSHPFARRFEADCRRSEQVLYATAALAASGYRPDLIVVHCGWGENLPLRAVFPKARIVVYCEFYYRSAGLDADFDSEHARMGVDGIVALHAKNAATLLALADAEGGLSPTMWQRSTYPRELQSKIEICHEGIDVDRIRPDRDATLTLPSGRVLRSTDEVVTFVARDLEPLRGFRSLMRALPAIMNDRPKAEIVMIGGDAVSYGALPVNGESWKTHMLAEVGAKIDLNRVHFLGRVSFETYLAALQVSTAHVYLTYPFVLSWSLLEAMAAGCRIVASDNMPVQEVMTGHEGLLVPFFDVARLAEAVTSILRDRGRFDAMGRQARATVEARYAKDQCLRRAKHLLGLS